MAALESTPWDAGADEEVEGWEGVGEGTNGQEVAATSGACAIAALTTWVYGTAGPKTAPAAALVAAPPRPTALAAVLAAAAPPRATVLAAPPRTTACAAAALRTTAEGARGMTTANITCPAAGKGTTGGNPFTRSAIAAAREEAMMVAATAVQEQAMSVAASVARTGTLTVVATV